MPAENPSEKGFGKRGRPVSKERLAVGIAANMERLEVLKGDFNAHKFDTERFLDAARQNREQLTNFAGEGNI